MDMTRISILIVRNTSTKSSLSRMLMFSGRFGGGSIGSPSRSYLRVKMLCDSPVNTIRTVKLFSAVASHM